MGIIDKVLFWVLYIVLWKKCISNVECFDVYNGLLFLVLWDVVFDCGFVIFDDEGNLLFLFVFSEIGCLVLYW